MIIISCTQSYLLNIHWIFTLDTIPDDNGGSITSKSRTVQERGTEKIENSGGKLCKTCYEFFKNYYSAFVVLIILKLWQTVVIVIHFTCIAKSPKPVEPLITLNEELKSINVIFEFYNISLLLYIIVYKNQNHKLIAEKNELSKTLEVEKKISKMKTIQIESGDTNILKLSVFSVQVKKRATNKSINFRDVYIHYKVRRNFRFRMNSTTIFNCATVY